MIFKIKYPHINSCDVLWLKLTFIDFTPKIA
jgi:hypothetical protein